MVIEEEEKAVSGEKRKKDFYRKEKLSISYIAGTQSINVLDGREKHMGFVI